MNMNTVNHPRTKIHRLVQVSKNDSFNISLEGEKIIRSINVGELVKIMDEAYFSSHKISSMEVKGE